MQPPYPATVLKGRSVTGREQRYCRRMRRARRTLALLGTTALMVSAAGCAEPEPEPEALSLTRAAEVYLEAVCPVNEAWDIADVELDRLRLAAQRGGETSTSAFADAMTNVADRSGAAASSLTSSERTWPDAARDPVADVAETLVTDREQAEQVAKLPVEQIVEYQWEGADGIGTAAAEARAALDLPADADAACEAWKTSGERETTDEAEGAEQ
ncbi:hypothetical protein PQI23_09915 [Leucobacter sp. USCH14]|uniref:hypothetical protein n=1 Tax=Leucobacter sp. USCH14 TaxID=3024838 RepID=UPI00309618A6